MNKKCSTKVKWHCKRGCDVMWRISEYDSKQKKKRKHFFFWIKNQIGQ